MPWLRRDYQGKHMLEGKSPAPVCGCLWREHMVTPQATHDFLQAACGWDLTQTLHFNAKAESFFPKFRSSHSSLQLRDLRHIP